MYLDGFDKFAIAIQGSKNRQIKDNRSSGQYPGKGAEVSKASLGPQGGAMQSCGPVLDVHEAGILGSLLLNVESAHRWIGKKAGFLELPLSNFPSFPSFPTLHLKTPAALFHL